MNPTGALATKLDKPATLFEKFPRRDAFITGQGDRAGSEDRFPHSFGILGRADLGTIFAAPFFENMLPHTDIRTWRSPCEDRTVKVSDKIDPQSDPALAAVRVCRISASGQAVQTDVLAVEEPLEIRLVSKVGGRRVHHTVSITMRTPGHDLELAVGFLFTEGVIAVREQVTGVRACGAGNVARVELQPGAAVDLSRLERHFYTSSSCGVCGKASLEAVRVCSPNRLPEGRPVVEAAVIHRLPEVQRAAQAVFDRTGGLHAAALFDARGSLLCLREDVGRHNALDKLIGAQFLAGNTPLSEGVLLVSGRVSFELVQKAVVAGIPILAAVGAPSSLAVSLAREHGMTVLGFVRQDRFNIYTGAERIRQIAAAAVPASSPEMRIALSVV